MSKYLELLSELERERDRLENSVIPNHNEMSRLSSEASNAEDSSFFKGKSVEATLALFFLKRLIKKYTPTKILCSDECEQIN